MSHLLSGVPFGTLPIWQPWRQQQQKGKKEDVGKAAQKLKKTLGKIRQILLNFACRFFLYLRKEGVDWGKKFFF